MIFTCPGASPICDLTSSAVLSGSFIHLVFFLFCTRGNEIRIENLKVDMQVNGYTHSR